MVTRWRRLIVMFSMKMESDENEGVHTQAFMNQKFLIIPVLDIMNKLAVHAIGGVRDKYKPLRSILCNTPDPVEVSLKLKAKFGFSILYIADLDSILKRQTNFELFKQIKEKADMELMVDAGMTDFDKLFKSGVSWAIVSTESISLNMMKELIEQYGRDRMIAGIDLEEGIIKGYSKEVKKLTPTTLARKIERMGYDKLIMIDLRRVGTERGVDLGLIKDVRRCVNLKLFIGGGIRDMADLEALIKVRVDGALLATALHRGRITSEMLHHARLT